jgi:hypothetical protein
MQRFEKKEERTKCLEEHEWEELSEVLKLLGPLEQLTRSMSGVKYTTVSLIVYHYSQMLNAIKSRNPTVRHLLFLFLSFIFFHCFSLVSGSRQTLGRICRLDCSKP